MNLVVDAGNTFTKVGIFEKDSFIRKQVFDSTQRLRDFLQQTPAENAIFSSVAHDSEQIAQWVQATKKIFLTYNLSVPLHNGYATPETLGVDRMAAACGAWSLFPKQNSLVIDIGTCINYEFITSNGVYKGGAISPGVRMRFEAMQRFTAKLPLGSPVDTIPLIGDSTLHCLQSGVMNGTLEEIKGIIMRYEKEYNGLNVILCGGDIHFFEKHLNPSIFVTPDLVLMGLNTILLYNVTR